MKNRLLFTILFSFLLSFSYAQSFFSKTQLIEDIDSLYSSIYEIHPNMFTVVSQQDFEEELNHIKKNLPDSLNGLDFYDRVAPLVVKIGDGHTGVGFPSKYLDKEKTRLFPFTIGINKQDYSLFVKRQMSDNAIIPENSKILSIDGRNSREVVTELIKYKNGESNNFRLSALEKQFSDYLWICYRNTSFTVEYKDQEERVHKVIIPGTTIRQFSDNSKKESNKKKEYYTYSIDKENKIAIIDFRQFQNPDKFKQFIESAFKDVKENGIEDLIIDIRNNGGGNSQIGDEFFQYISPVPFRQFGRSIVKISPKVKLFYEQYFEEMDKKGELSSFLKEHYERDIKNKADSLYVGSENMKLHALRQNPYRFTGNIYLLTSGSTFSSASKFSWAFKYFNMGTIVGEETGRIAVAFGDIIYQSLPNTGLKYSVSHKRFYSYGATDENTHGTIPDYEVNADDAMGFAIDLIKNNHKE